MSGSVEDIVARLERWPRGALALSGPVARADADRLTRVVPRPLPGDYLALLQRFDGLDLRGDRLFSAAEAIEQFDDLERSLSPVYRTDPDWTDARPPRELFPIATDLEGNLKCLDLSTSPAEVVDWHRESGLVTTWFDGVSAFVASALDALELRFDPKGRPRRLRPGEAMGLERREMELHLDHAPNGTHPLLELARWEAKNSTPEVALIAFRRAAAGFPERPIQHLDHALFAIQCGRFTEARYALRRALAVPRCKNPRKHDFRYGPLAGTHVLLGRLYEAVGQRRKADEQRRLADSASKRYESDWADEEETYLAALAEVSRTHKPAVAEGQKNDRRGRRAGEEPDPSIAFDITDRDEPFDPYVPSDPYEPDDPFESDPDEDEEPE